MMTKFLIAAASISFLTTAAIAQSGTNTASSAAVANQVAPAQSAEKKICKRLDRTGSRMTEKVCLTKEDWEKVRQEVAG